MSIQVYYDHLQEVRQHPVFICGHPKAGTSLVRAILDSHPELIVYPEESMFFRQFLIKTKEYDLNNKLRFAEEHLIHFFKWQKGNPQPEQVDYPDRDYSQYSFNMINQYLHEYVERDYQHDGDILSAAVLAFGKAGRSFNKNTRFWVEKSPYNEFFSEQIFIWWEKARCIHVIRDPRDNYASYRRKHPDWKPEFFANNWRHSTSIGIHNQKKYKPENYFIIKYEDLTSSPENGRDTIYKLVNFLGISYDEKLLIPTRANIAWKGNSMFSNQFEGISSNPIARWKENLSKDDAEVIQIMTEPFISDFKYVEKKMTKQISAKSYFRAGTWPLRRKIQRFLKS